jgi:hypothetical protein
METPTSTITRGPLSRFIAQYRNARAVINQVRAGEWEFEYRTSARYCYHATRKGKTLWVANGGFFCDLRHEGPAFGLLFRHWVWHAAAGKEHRRVMKENSVRNKIPDLTA